MAIYKGSDIAGMVGPVVFLKMKGKGVIRRAPKQREKDSWSGQQVMYRNKISRLASFWNQLVPDDCKRIYARAAQEMTPYNLFLKTNLPAFSPDGTQIDPAWLHLSVGKLPLPHQLSAIFLPGDPLRLQVTWLKDPLDPLARPSDQLQLIISSDSKYTSPIFTGILREQESATIDLPSGMENVKGVYLFFVDEKEELYSVDTWFKV